MSLYRAIVLLAIMGYLSALIAPVLPVLVATSALLTAAIAMKGYQLMREG